MSRQHPQSAKAAEARIGRDGVVVHAGDTIECPHGCRHVVDRIHWRDGEAFMVVDSHYYLSEHLRVRVVERAKAPEAKSDDW